MDRETYRTFKDENPDFIPACRGVLRELAECGVTSYAASKLIAVVEFRLLREPRGIVRNRKRAASIPHEFAPLMVADLKVAQPDLVGILRTKSIAGYRGRRADQVRGGAA